MKREKSLKVSPNKNPDPPGHASPFLYSFLVALGLFSLECLFFKPFFHINDDDWALFISKGVGIALKPDAHLFYNNILLGQMLKSLYSLFPGFGWYTDLLLLTQFLGFWALLAALLARPGGKFKFLFSAAIFLLVDGYYFDQTNYTFCTFLAAQGGFFLFASMFERKDPAFQNPALALGSACLLISSLLRLEAFCFSVLTSLPFLAWSLWKGRGHRRNLYAVSILALLILACALFDSFCYRSDPAWGEFTKFNRYSASKSWTAYEYNGQTKPFFDEVDWTRNDLALFQDW
ncbi:MAG TPA: hypothetical protein VJ873_05465, partial [bacterium]|nr:hypothetical protein [bacterium]